MLFRVLMALIENHQLAGLQEKIDVLYAANHLTNEEYAKLIAALT